MQSDESARRIIDIGAEPEPRGRDGQPEVRFARVPGAAAGRGAGRVLRYFRIPPSRPVFIAASTLKGEEAPVLAGVRRRAARASDRAAHHRAAEARALCRGRGAGPRRRGCASCAGRSSPSTPNRAPTSSSSIRLASWRIVFQVATVVFVGGSLVDQGGHNILEPAVHGKPIVFGPHMENFAEIAEHVPDAAGRRAGGRRRRSRRRRSPAGGRSRRTRAARRGRPRAGRGQPRREAAHAPGDRVAAAAPRQPRRRPPLPATSYASRSSFA